VRAPFSSCLCVSSGDSFYAAYHSVLPKEPGFEERAAVYQLFHLLNHLVICTYKCIYRLEQTAQFVSLPDCWMCLALIFNSVSTEMLSLVCVALRLQMDGSTTPLASRSASRYLAWLAEKYSNITDDTTHYSTVHPSLIWAAAPFLSPCLGGTVHLTKAFAGLPCFTRKLCLLPHVERLPSKLGVALPWAHGEQCLEAAGKEGVRETQED